MASTIERELKLDVPEAFSLGRLPETLAGVTASALECRRLHTLYYDTEDLRLARWSCSLRYREQEGWTLKLSVPQREERTFAGTRASVPPEALDIASAFLRGAQVAPVAELRTLRFVRRLSSSGGEVLGEVIEDDVRVVAGRSVVRRFRQIEIELAEDAPEKTLRALAEALRREGAGEEDATPKYLYALGAARVEPELPHVSLDESSTGAEVVRAALATSVERLIRSDAGVRRRESSAAHQARVAVRRLRSDLQSFSLALDAAWAQDLSRRLKRLSRALGAARDCDVLLERLRLRAARLDETDAAQAARALAPFERERERSYDLLLAAMRDGPYAALLNDLIAAAQRPEVSERANERAGDLVAQIMHEAWHDLADAANASHGAASDGDLHRIRIKAKRVRYAAETVGAVVGRPALSFARRLERLQSVLGEQHDAVVAQKRLRELSSDSGVAFVAGKFAMQEDDAARKGRTRWRSAWRKCRKRNPFWGAAAPES